MFFFLLFLVFAHCATALQPHNICNAQAEASRTIRYSVPHTLTEPWLKRSFLEQFKTLFGIDTFIETGTYLGNTAEEASKIFAEIHTIELQAEFYSLAKKRFSHDSHVSVYWGDSGEYLNQLVLAISSRIFFYLDGHYSGEGTAMGREQTPILRELEAIAEAKKPDSVILIDDIRFFEEREADYPSLTELTDALLRINPLFQFCFLGDALLAFPSDPFVNVSPLVRALTIHRFASFYPELGKNDLEEAERTIGRADGDEREALISYYRTFSPLDDRFGYRGYASLWYEFLLKEHVIECLEKAEFDTSNLSIGVLGIDGMSSSKVRHFLNNLCSFPKTSYLEIGCWKGSTLVAALYKNTDSVVQSVAIDNWSEFGGPREIFLSNVTRFLIHPSLKIVNSDCFTIDKQAIFSQPVNLYFYDGNHEEQSQESAFTYFNDIFEPVFIAVVDDWNDLKVRNGTRLAFQKLGYQILFDKEIWTPTNGDTLSWWNGLYVAVIKKSLH